MRQAWQAGFSARARDYWTPERTAALTGGKERIWRSLLAEAESAPLLRALGLLQRDASLAPWSARKYMQINRIWSRCSSRQCAI